MNHNFLVLLLRTGVTISFQEKITFHLPSKHAHTHTQYLMHLQCKIGPNPSFWKCRWHLIQLPDLILQKRNIWSIYQSIYDLTPAVIKAAVNDILCRELHDETDDEPVVRKLKMKTSTITISDGYPPLTSDRSASWRRPPIAALLCPHQPSLLVSSCINPWIIITSNTPISAPVSEEPFSC